MANSEHFKILLEGIDYWNQWREEQPEVMPDLRDVNLGAEVISGKIIAEVHGGSKNRKNLIG